MSNVHCKEPTPKFERNIPIKGNFPATVPIPCTFVCLWAIYIFTRSVCLSAAGKYVDRSREYINCSQTHECWIRNWGRAIPFLGIHNLGFSLQRSKTAYRNYDGLRQLHEDIGGFCARIAVTYWSGGKRPLLAVNHMTGSGVKDPKALSV